VLKSSKNYFLAEKFTDYLQSMEGKGVLLKYGFDVP
jgi:ABC-type molybdate transport system substrate-binding protein